MAAPILMPKMVKEPRPAPVVTEIDAPMTPITNTFTYQSYFDTTLLQKALLAQPVNAPIVPSTLRKDDFAGYGVALSPMSQTPVAVQLPPGSGQGSTAKVLRPGEVWWPLLKKGQPFAGITWGLPFGWLGGGTATLYIFHTPDAKVVFHGQSPEIIFHRLTVKILADSGGFPAIVKNWPTRFPWVDASQGSTAVSQAGSPTLAITPTRVVARLQVSDLAAAASMRAAFRGSLDFDQNSLGVVGTATALGANTAYVDVSWPQVTASPEGNVVTIAALPALEFNSGPWLLGCEGGGLHLFDNTNASLTNQYVDFVRYGRL